MSQVLTLTPFVVALDGPAASGKSTVGQGAADALGFFYFDTGVLYRALTHAALEHGVAAEDGKALGQLAQQSRFDVGPPSVDDGRQLDVRVDGVDVSHSIRGPRVDALVSRVSAHAEVREALRTPQRAAIHPPGTIMAGRDIGTVIVPGAQLKIWLTASAEERAARRARQTGESFDAVLRTLLSRDQVDGSRAVAPMQRAPDAVDVTTDGISADQVIARIVSLARARMDAGGAATHPSTTSPADEAGRAFGHTG